MTIEATTGKSSATPLQPARAARHSPAAPRRPWWIRYERALCFAGPALLTRR